MNQDHETGSIIPGIENQEYKIRNIERIISIKEYKTKLKSCHAEASKLKFQSKTFIIATFLTLSHCTLHSSSLSTIALTVP